jgi:hypothetical protein
LSRGLNASRSVSVVLAAPVVIAQTLGTGKPVPQANLGKDVNLTSTLGQME